MALLCQENGVPFSGIEFRQRCVRDPDRLDHLQPRGDMGHPGADQRWRMRVLEFLQNGLRDEHPVIEGGENVHVSQEDQIAEWGIIRHNKHYWPSERTVRRSCSKSSRV